MANLCKDSLPDLATAEGQAAFAKAFEPLPDLVLPENLSSLSGHRTGDADALPKVQPFLQALIAPLRHCRAS